MSKEDWEKVIQTLEFKEAHVREHVLDTFRELAQKDPEKAVTELPNFIKKATSAGNNFFAGYGCGGPFEGVTAPLLATIGIIYQSLDRNLREEALNQCLNFLDEQNYFLAQNNIQYIDEPWLIRDILVNRSLYWCGFNEYSDKIQKMKSWSEFEKEFLKEKEDDTFYVDAKSLFWLSMATAWKDCCNSEIRQGFAEIFPDLIDRTKDFIAGMTYTSSQNDFIKKNIPLENGIESRLTERYDSAWKQDLKRKIKEEQWILLKETRNSKRIPTAIQGRFS